MKNLSADTISILAQIPNLKARAEVTVTVEDLTVLKEVGSFFTEKLQRVKDIFTINNQRADELDAKVINTHFDTLISNHSKIKAIIDNGSYSAVGKIEIPVMIGMDVDLVTASDKLVTLKDLLLKELAVKLNDLDTMLGMFIGDKHFRTSSRPLDISYDYEHATVKKVLTEIINPNLLTDRKKINELLPNLSSLSVVYKNLISLGNVTSVKYLKDIEKSTKSVSEKTDSLYELLKEKKDVVVEQNRLIDLGYAIEETANLVTVVISAVHLINQLVITTNITIDEITQRTM